MDFNSTPLNLLHISLYRQTLEGSNPLISLASLYNTSNYASEGEQLIFLQHASNE